ncbi:MAG: FAD-binding protein [Acidobacteria bacterium]|nr:FAD-binding protein [Acidobacteriota bacterium]
MPRLPDEGGPSGASLRSPRSGRRVAPPPFAAAARLAADLAASLRGEVRFDAGSRALYATDGSNYRQVPIGVVLPRDAGDVEATVAACRRHGAPVLARGGGTSLAGQCCNVAVVLDFSKYMHRLVELDPARRLARVEPGIVLDTLRRAAERHHLTYGPDPASHDRCTLGGMIGNNSCGVHALMAGKTVDNVEELEVLTYDGLRLRVGPTSDEELARIVAEGGRRGRIYAGLAALRDRFAGLIRERYPDIPRRVSGYNLDQLLPENGFHVARALVGSECTCVTVLEATLRLVPSPPFRTLAVLGYSDVYAAADHVPEVLAWRPIGLEGLDHRLTGFMRAKGLYPESVARLPPGDAWLLVELGGDSQEEADAKAKTMADALRRRPGAPSVEVTAAPEEAKRIWEVRESALGATAFVPGMADSWEGWEDAAVPPGRLGAYLRDFRGLLDRHGYDCAMYGHFGQGCVHMRIDFDFQSRAGIDRYLAFIDQAADLVVAYGGSLSGEHGDGQSRAALLPKMFGPELVGAFEEFKALWDPEWKMNPGKLVRAFRPDENLRLGLDYRPWDPPTHLRFAEDRGSFAHAALRCVGVGKCRRLESGGGVMCPSYMATLEERHSTRGRARLLFEMLERDAIGRRGWRDESVKEALDLCLSCKGCKSDCPVNVDMAAYKAEFLHHYYKGRLRPRSAYAFGLIHWWARLASPLAPLVNFATQAPWLSALAKAAAGMAPERRIPRFAGQTFRAWWRARQAAGGAGAASGTGDTGGAAGGGGPRNPDGPRVVLWADTFTNYFQPAAARAAVEVLEAAGKCVVVPEQALCCGRPLYDYGMLRLARRQLRRTLGVLRDEIRAGTPLVALEPSCLAVFRDELARQLPDDEDARRLARQSFLLSELLACDASGWQAPRLPGRRRQALVQTHCHHRAMTGSDAQRRLLDQLGLDCEALDAGCCGMAGAFGFERGERYAVSMRCGERALLPAVRQAAPDCFIVADGFSCREQIAQGTNRRGLHLAQVLQLALRQRVAGAAAAPKPAAAEPGPPAAPEARDAPVRPDTGTGTAIAGPVGALPGTDVDDYPERALDPVPPPPLSPLAAVAVMAAAAFGIGAVLGWLVGGAGRGAPHRDRRGGP